ncbi:copper-transporting ATPase 1 isoform X2, partial [Biomphalaria glabrata]
MSVTFTLQFTLFKITVLFLTILTSKMSFRRITILEIARLHDYSSVTDLKNLLQQQTGVYSAE